MCKTVARQHWDVFDTQTKVDASLATVRPKKHSQLSRGMQNESFVTSAVVTRIVVMWLEQIYFAIKVLTALIDQRHLGLMVSETLRSVHSSRTYDISVSATCLRMKIPNLNNVSYVWWGRDPFVYKSLNANSDLKSCFYVFTFRW